MSKRTKDSVVAIVAIVAAIVALCLAFGRTTEEIKLDTYEVLGVVTAEETAKLLGNKGRVVLMVRDTGPDKNPSVEAQVKAFQQTLKPHAGMNVVINRVPVTPMLMMSTGGGVPVDQLFKAIETNAKPEALVLFFGLPQLTEQELEALKRTGVRIVVVSSFRPTYQRLLERRAIHLAVVPKPGAPATTSEKPRTARERFDQEYVVMTPAVASGLP